MEDHPLREIHLILQTNIHETREHGYIECKMVYLHCAEVHGTGYNGAVSRCNHVTNRLRKYHVYIFPVAEGVHRVDTGVFN